MKKRISVILIALSMLFCIHNIKQVSAAGSTSAASRSVESAITWALKIANDNTHGYTWGGKGNPDYDCASFVIAAFKQAGFNVGNATYTGNMRAVFEKCGFEWIPKSKINLSNSSSLKRGDILLNEVTHTEIYTGSNKMVGAHKGTYNGKGLYSYGEKKGDQGNEISEISYSNSSSWDGVLRYRKPNIKLRVWWSKDKMGSEPANPLLKGERYYLCYEVIDVTTNKRLNGQNYKAKEIIKKSSGSTVYSYTYSNSNNNWISSVLNTTGKYIGRVELTGDYNLSCEVSMNLIKLTCVSSVYFSDSAWGSKKTSLTGGKTQYIVYKKVEKTTKKYLNTVKSLSYKINIKVYKNGKVVLNKSYANKDQLCVKFTPKKNAKYKVVIKTSGNLSGSVSLTKTAS